MWSVLHQGVSGGHGRRGSHGRTVVDWTQSMLQHSVYAAKVWSWRQGVQPEVSCSSQGGRWRVLGPTAWDAHVGSGWKLGWKISVSKSMHENLFFYFASRNFRSLWGMESFRNQTKRKRWKNPNPTPCSSKKPSNQNISQHIQQVAITACYRITALWWHHIIIVCDR